MVLFKSGFTGGLEYALHLFTFHYGSIQIGNCFIYQEYGNKFTFHYGSIQICNKFENEEIKIEFTFHYGSIQIDEVTEDRKVKDNLHSTMVLFK